MPHLTRDANGRTASRIWPYPRVTLGGEMRLADRLPSRTLLDGGVGTELIASGLVRDVDCPDAWNLDRPDVVRDIHQAYFAAGADAVQTNTFGATRLRLVSFGRQAEVRRLNLAGALLAREVRPTGRLVIGDLGPTGALPPPEGRADLIELEDCYAEQAMALAEGGVDFLHVETMYHPKEARAALRGVHEGAPGLAVVASMTCRRTAAGYATTLGFSPEAMLATFLEEGADAVGANCTLTPAEMLDLVRLLRSRTGLPIFAKPTARPSGGDPVSPENMGAGALALFAAGATAVGGCCGSTPIDINHMKGAVSRSPASLGDLDLG
jgi:5-methyltetrahydrofolate--homocysteine methyltransferase